MGGRGVPVRNIHATLVFLGSVDEHCLRCARTAADRIRAGAFTLVFDRVGYWRKPRVVWSAPKSLPDDLISLQADLHQALASCGMQLEERPYRCHVTLRRKAGHRPALLRHVPVEWSVKEFCLMESKTLPGGPVYEVVGRWPLGAGRT